MIKRSRYLNNKMIIPKIGLWMQIPSPHLTLCLAEEDVDFVCVDMEHGAISLESLSIMTPLIQSKGTQAFARVQEPNATSIKQALDTGIDGIIIPMINSYSIAKNAVNACFYPKKGTRGVGFSLANSYGKYFKETYEKNHTQLTIILQIEHIDAVEHLDDILTLDGVSGAMIGPYDLSASMGIPAEFDHPNYKDVETKIKNAISKSGKKACIHIVEPNPSQVKDCIREGFSLIAYAIDAVLIRHIISDHMKQIRKIL